MIRILALNACLMTALSSAHGQSRPPPGDMRLMIESFQKIEAQLPDASKNASTISEIDGLLTKTRESQGRTPPGFDKVTGPNRDRILARLKMQTNLMVDKLSKMKSQLQANDNPGARQTFNEMRGGGRPPQMGTVGQRPPGAPMPGGMTPPSPGMHPGLPAGAVPGIGVGGPGVPYVPLTGVQAPKAPPPAKPAR